MIRKALILLFLFSATISFSQKKGPKIKPKEDASTTKKEEISPIAAVDVNSPEYQINKRPSFPGGVGEMFRFINKNIQKPDTIMKGGDGKVFLWFNVSEDGSISNIKVIKEIPGCPACNDEAIRLVKLMPKWDPCIEHGKAVKTDYNFPVSFHPPLTNH
jgi:outer membrane biosynthesis protein TonB